MFKLQSPSKHYLTQYTYQDIFSTAPNSFRICQFWCLIVLLLYFVSPPPYKHLQNVSLWGLFSPRETKRVSWGKIRWIGRVWHGSHAGFGQKLRNTQCSVDRCARISPIVKETNVLKESSKKKNHWSQTQPLITLPGGKQIQMGPKHSPSGRSLYDKGPALQKIIPFWGLPPCIHTGAENWGQSTYICN